MAISVRLPVSRLSHVLWHNLAQKPRFTVRYQPCLVTMAADRRFSAYGLKTFNGYGTKTPFLIGVAGGTASGKVCTL